MDAGCGGRRTTAASSSGEGVSGHLVVVGLGYCAEALARRLLATGWRVSGTTRSAEKAARLMALGIRVLDPADVAGALRDATGLLGSVPPDEGGDPALAALAPLPRVVRWTGYLSSTGVYGDHGGAWVDEDAETRAVSSSGRARLQAEAAWQREGAHVFRLAGIYGPGRNALLQVREGRAQRIVKPGLVFSRVHVDDIVGALLASLARPRPGAVYNVADDEPAPPHDVVTEACALLGVTPPPLRGYDEVAETLSPALRAFYAESRRVRNARIKRELGVTLLHPDYRAGLARERARLSRQDG